MIMGNRLSHLRNIYYNVTLFCYLETLERKAKKFFISIGIYTSCNSNFRFFKKHY